MSEGLVTNGAQTYQWGEPETSQLGNLKTFGCVMENVVGRRAETVRGGSKTTSTNPHTGAPGV